MHRKRRLNKLKYEWKAHMQVWALLSQLHRHKEALSHAQVAISISHYLAKDFLRLAKYYVKRLQDPSAEAEEPDPKSKVSAPAAKNKISAPNNWDGPEVDFLYDPQLSLLAKTAIKILPIAEELQK